MKARLNWNGAAQTALLLSMNCHWNGICSALCRMKCRPPSDRRHWEAQAITARSYAYNQFYANTYCAYGAHVTDTTASQVYLGYAENETAAQAVKATEGMVCRNENRCGGADLFLFHLLWLRGRQSGGLVEGRQLFRQGKILFAGADLRGFRAAADRGGMACLLAGLEETGI